MANSPKAVILLSGGLDSTTILATAKMQGFSCYALSIAYGQRAEIEIEAAKGIANKMQVASHRILQLDLRGGSALTTTQPVPKGRSAEQIATGIPSTYVPARNTIMLSHALGWAEILGAFDIFVGVNAVDYSGYPDCRTAFIEAFENMANVATSAAVEGRGQFRIHAPLIELSKADIIRRGIELGVDYSMTHSCYDPKGELACRECDACILRREGFVAAGLADPTRYVLEHQAQAG